jgi:alkanesulfonate monooxygenase SsuD/methylene tetrahydromethanopterin reductase-like flavin-dependent oxidoreductase (luciferase family)
VDTGRDPASLRTTVALVVCCGSDEAEFRRRAEAIGREPDELRANGAAGLPDEVVERLHAFAEAGAETAYLQLLDLTDLDHVQLLAAEVMPKVAAA